MILKIWSNNGTGFTICLFFDSAPSYDFRKITLFLKTSIPLFLKWK